MKTSGFSYTLSAFVLLMVLAAFGGYFLGRGSNKAEGFESPRECNVCGNRKVNCKCQIAKPSGCGAAMQCPMCSKCKPTCGCPQAIPSVDQAVGPNMMNTAVLPGTPATSPCPMPDPTKYVLKSTVPPCPPMPDMSRYMLKTECPAQPDMSKYVLKSSVPKCPPCISTCSKPCKIGECPPCPRPRCPTPNCPDPKPCPACPPVQVAPCPEPRVQCKAAYEPQSTVRPMLASTTAFGL
jgi:hypothetical protein